jgi:hypothetical protein
MKRSGARIVYLAAWVAVTYRMADGLRIISVIAVEGIPHWISKNKERLWSRSAV